MLSQVTNRISSGAESGSPTAYEVRRPWVYIGSVCVDDASGSADWLGSAGRAISGVLCRVVSVYLSVCLSASDVAGVSIRVFIRACLGPFGQ